MSTRTTAEQLEEMHQRIEGLQTKAQTAAASGKASIEAQVGALRRQEASARTAVHEAQGAASAQVSEYAHAADDKLQQLGARLKAAEDGLTAELAEDKKTFSAAMEADLEDFKALIHQLDVKASAKAGTTHERAEAGISELRRRRDIVAERLEEVREASGEQWRDRKEGVDRARAELEQKLDEVSKKLE